MLVECIDTFEPVWNWLGTALFSLANESSKLPGSNLSFNLALLRLIAYMCCDATLLKLNTLWLSGNNICAYWEYIAFVGESSFRPFEPLPALCP